MNNIGASRRRGEACLTTIQIFSTVSGAKIRVLETTSHETGNITWMPDGSALVAAGIVVPGDAYTRGGMDAWTGVVEIYRRDNATRALHRQL